VVLAADNNEPRSKGLPIKAGYVLSGIFNRFGRWLLILLIWVKVRTRQGSFSCLLYAERIPSSMGAKIPDFNVTVHGPTRRPAPVINNDDLYR
jgi:hypothetical protein